MQSRFETQLTHALHQRRDLDLGDTDCWRVLDGEGDGLPGVTVDNFAGRWLISTEDNALVAARDLPEEPPRHCLSWWRRERSHDTKRSPVCLHGDKRDSQFTVTENGLRFQIDFAAGYSQGIFLDQRHNRTEARSRVKSGDTVLNTFAYTCAFSVAAAAAGAVTTSLDLSSSYLDWGKRNLALNKIDSQTQFFCKGDTLNWLRRFDRKGRTFTGVILDPPTFSRAGRSVFRVEKDYDHLAERAARVVAHGGWMLCCCNCMRMSASAFREQVAAGIERAEKRVQRIKPAGMPPDFTGPTYLQSLWVDLD